MKNQYFGDINDYRKYGLLRILTNIGQLSLAICWMLTEADGSTDGKFTEYLACGNRWRIYDPELFDKMRDIVINQGLRNVSHLTPSGIMGKAISYEPILCDHRIERRQYFEKFWEQSQRYDLVFFDPDNGLEVKSKPKGRKNSSKYLYWDELIETYQRGHSILIYQHFCRQKRDAFISSLATKILDKTGAKKVFSFSTSNVVFLLIPIFSMIDMFDEQSVSLDQTWKNQIMVQIHSKNQEIGVGIEHEHEHDSL